MITLTGPPLDSAEQSATLFADNTDESDSESDYQSDDNDEKLSTTSPTKIDLVIKGSKHSSALTSNSATGDAKAKTNHTAKSKRGNNGKISSQEAGDKNDKLYYSSDSEEDEEERDLESILFGSGFNENLYKFDAGKGENEDGDASVTQEEPISFVIDTVGDTKSSNKTTDTVTELSLPFDKNKRKPAWLDCDDDNEVIDLHSKNRSKKLRVIADEKVIDGNKFQDRLKSQFEKVMGAPTWASLPDKKVEIDEDEELLLRSSAKMLAKSEELQSGSLRIRKEKMLGEADKEASVRTIRFHPGASMALVAGINKRLRIHRVDNDTNQCIQTVFLENFKIHQAEFTADGTRVIISGDKPVYMVYDMLQGKVRKIPGIAGHKEVHLERFSLSRDGRYILFEGAAGYIHIVYANTYQWYHSFKMNGSLKSAVFSSDSKLVYSTGGDGEVYVFSLAKRECIHRFTDEGSVKSTVIAISPNNKWLAVGSNCGIVNIYDESHLKSRVPKPAKIIKNLTNAITGIKFNPTSEIVAVYSMLSKSAIKLIHLPSLSVFPNWPPHSANKKNQLDYVNSVDFSPNSGYMAVGVSSGKALMYRLFHYKDF